MKLPPRERQQCGGGDGSTPPSAAITIRKFSSETDAALLPPSSFDNQAKVGMVLAPPCHNADRARRLRSATPARGQHRQDEGERQRSDEFPCTLVENSAGRKTMMTTRVA